DASLSHLRDRRAQTELGSVFPGSLHEKARSARRIHHRILCNQKPSGKSIPQVWLSVPQGVRVENLGGNAALRIELTFTQHLRHFFFVGRNPDRSALLIFDIVRQLKPQRLPELLRISRKG